MTPPDPAHAEVDRRIKFANQAVTRLLWKAAVRHPDYPALEEARHARGTSIKPHQNVLEDALPVFISLLKIDGQVCNSYEISTQLQVPFCTILNEEIKTSLFSLKPFQLKKIADQVETLFASKGMPLESDLVFRTLNRCLKEIQSAELAP